MKKTILLIVCMLIITCGFSQTFERAFSGFFYNSVFPGRNIQITDEGEYLIAGKTVPLNGYNEIALTKYSINGDSLWTKTYGKGEYVNHHVSIEKSIDGGYIISGSGPHDIKIIKINTNGESLWSKQISTGEYDDFNPVIIETSSDNFVLSGTKSLGPDMNYQRVISFIKIDSDGQIITEKNITEETNLTLQFFKKIKDWGFILGGYMGFQYPEGSFLYIAMLNNNGDTIWTKKFYQIKTILSSNIKQTEDNNFIIVGTNILATTLHKKIFFMRTDTAGNLIWQKSYLSEKNRGYGVEQTNDNGFVITGSTESSGNGQQDLLIMKTNIIGDSLWAKTFGGVYDDLGYEIIQTGDSGFIINGATNSYGLSLSYLIKTDSEGNVECRKDFSRFFKPNINKATIDSTSTKILVHYKPEFGSTEIQLYKESPATGKYDLANTLTDVNIGYIVDTATNPNIASHRYQIRMINKCGDASLFSSAHKTIYLKVYDGGNNTRNLIWNHYEGTDVETYTILSGSDKNEMNTIDYIPGTNNIYTDLNPSDDKIFYQIKAILSNPNSKNPDDSLISFSNIAAQITTGIPPEINNRQSQIKIYPNPFSDKATIEFPNPENYKFSLYIIDISGRVIKKYSNIQGTRFALDKGNLANGIYFIELRGPGLFRKKILVK
jgi:hypothetical protein